MNSADITRWMWSEVRTVWIKIRPNNMSGSSPTKCRLDLDQIYFVKVLSVRNKQVKTQQKQLNVLSPPVKVFLLTVPRRCFFCGSFCYLCFVLIVFCCLFIAVLWSPAGRALTSWLSWRMWCLIVFLSLSHVMSWVRCGAWLYWFLIFLTLCN